MEDMILNYLPEVVLALCLALAVIVVMLIYIMTQHKILKSDRGIKEEDAVSSAAISLDNSTVSRGKQQDILPEDDEAVVAAIIAAICTYSGMSSNEFIIKSIKLVNDNGSIWRRQSLIS